MDYLDDGVQDEIYFSSYQNKEVLESYEEDVLNDDYPNCGKKYPQYIERYIINLIGMFKWKSKERNHKQIQPSRWNVV